MVQKRVGQDGDGAETRSALWVWSNIALAGIVNRFHLTVTVASGIALAGCTEAATTDPSAVAEPAAIAAGQANTSANATTGVCSRTPQVRDAIMKAAGRSTCESVTAEDLQNIVTLDVSGAAKAITGLRSNVCNVIAQADPEKWRVLRELWDERRCGLDGTEPRPSVPAAAGQAAAPELHALQQSDFAGLSSLQDLILKDNWLTTLPAGVFSELGQLRVLDLRRNLLAGLREGLFDNTPLLSELYAHGNRLTTLPDDIFDGLAELNTVDFFGNRIVRLPEGIFDETVALRWVGFTNNELTELPQGLFAHMPDLRAAEFGNNYLTELPEKLFDGHTALQRVEFPANGLSEFPVEILESRALRYINLAANQLTSLPAEGFSGHPELQGLDFTANSLTELPDGLVTGLGALGSFRVGFNQITSVPDSLFGGNESLRHVSFWSNQIEELPDGLFADSPELEWVDFDDNQLVQLPEGLFAGLSELGAAFFDGNPGTPFSLDPVIERVDQSDPLAPGPATLRMRIATGVPDDMTVELSGVGDLSLSVTTVRIDAGETVSEEFTARYSGAPAGVYVRHVDTQLGETYPFGAFDVPRGAHIVLANPPNAPVKFIAAYLTQAAQNMKGTVPLVADRDALLRVFVTSDVRHSLQIPLRGQFFVNGELRCGVEVEPPAEGIPSDVDEGRMGGSYNIVVPGSCIQPGLELTVEVDEAGRDYVASGSQLRFPEDGRLAFDVRQVAPLDVKVVPIMFAWHKNSAGNAAVAEFAADLATDDSYSQLQFTRKLLPVSELQVSVREPYYTWADTTSRGGIELLSEIQLLRHTEAGGTDQYYHGLLAFPNFRGPGWGFGGIAANIPAYTALTISHYTDGSFRGNRFGQTFAHELGHDVNLRHAPGCGAGGPDRDYPHDRGVIGVWGYDVALPGSGLKRPGVFDYMSYCDPTWVSDYQFARSLDHLSRPGRTPAAMRGPAQKTLVLRGGIQAGEMVLASPLALHAPVKRPERGGPYRLTGYDGSARTLFSLSFTPDPTDHAGEAFLFALPFDPAWTNTLERVVLEGPEGTTVVDRDAINQATVLYDRGTGRIRSIASQWPVELPPELGPGAGVQVRKGMLGVN